MKLDATDRRLLALLQEDSSLSYAALGEAVGLSVSAVNERVRKLERGGVIRDYVARLDPAAVGAGILAFVELGLEGGAAERLAASLLARPEVLEVHRISGPRQFLLKLRAADLPSLEALLEGIAGAAPARPRLTVALRTLKETPALPLA